jgi:hypothetical protein
MPRAERQAAKKDREAEKKVASESAARARAEDDYWAAAGEGKTSKAAAKRAQQEAAKGEAAAKKLEAKRLAAQEEAELSAPKGSGGSGGGGKGGRLAKPTGQHHGGFSSGGKVTQHELQQQREREDKERAQAAEARARAARREVTEDDYARAVEVENTNKADEGSVDARSLTEAVQALAHVGLGNDGGRTSPGLGALGAGAAGAAAGGGDAHPERRMKAAWLAYEEKQLPLLRMEKPGLKQSQYKDMIWRQWQKAPENPMVAAGRR